jgi:hypothetical protein
MSKAEWALRIGVRLLISGCTRLVRRKPYRKYYLDWSRHEQFGVFDSSKRWSRVYVFGVWTPVMKGVSCNLKGGV